MRHRSKLNLLILLVLLPVLICPTFSFADLPVIDPVEIQQLYQEFKQLQKQYELLNNAYENAKQQLSTAEAALSQAKQLVSDAQGHYGYGALLNSDADLKNRE